MPGEFAQLVNEGAVGRVVRGFERVIARSFQQDKGTRTQAEVRRRFDICARIFRMLRGDLKWTVPRILDHLGEYLRAELDGLPWTPNERSLWTPPQDNG